MLTLRSTYRIRPWQRARWWSLVLGVACSGAALLARAEPNAPWYQRPVLAVAVQLAASANAAQRIVHDWWSTAESRELARLHDELASARAALAIAEHERDASRALVRSQQLFSSTTPPLLGAHVVLHSLQSTYKMLLIDRGRDDGVHAGMIAVANGALVGRVERVAAHSASVLLLTDPAHAVDVLVQRSQTRGIVEGRGDAAGFARVLGVSRLAYLPDGADVIEGDVLLTSGLDGRYPAAIPVGDVRRVLRGADQHIATVDVAPFINWHAVQDVVLVEAVAP